MRPYNVEIATRRDAPPKSRSASVSVLYYLQASSSPTAAQANNAIGFPFSMSVESLYYPPMPRLAPDSVGGLGVLYRLRRNALTAFPARCFSEPVVRLRLPGRALFLVTDGTAMIEMLQTRAADFERMPAGRRVLGPLAGNGLLTSEGERWRRQRRAMAPAFTPRIIPMMAAHIMRATEPACAKLAVRANALVDLYGAMQTLSLDIAAASMFSIEATDFRDQLGTMVTSYVTTIGRPAPEDFVLPSWAPTPLMMRRRAFRRRWLRLMHALLDRRRREPLPEQPRDLFDLLTQAHGASDPELLIDEVATMIVAGHETTALTLFWALVLLCHAPSWQDAIRDEARRVDLSAGASAESLRHLPRTRAVVNETLRLYSPAFMTARLCVRDTRIAGHAVPARSMMLAPFYLLHRNANAWSDPGRFDPSRFLLDPDPDRTRFLPFGTGPHVCIGAQLAITEAVLVLARLLSQFEVTLPTASRPVLPVATLSTRPDHAPKFAVTER